MKVFSVCGFVPVLGLILVQSIIADDAPLPEAPDGAAPKPVVVDIAPIAASAFAGFNRLEEGWVRIEGLKESLGYRYPFYEVGEFADVYFGSGDVEGPLVFHEVFDIEREYVRSHGGTMLVRDRAEAIRNIPAPEGVVDHEVFVVNFGLIGGELSMAFDDDRLSISQDVPSLERILASQPLREFLPEAENLKLSAADCVGILKDGWFLDFYVRDLLPARPLGNDPQWEGQELWQLADGIEWLTSGIWVEFANGETEPPTGASFHASLLFDHEPESDSANLLASLSSEASPATLAGLPEGDPLFIFAASLAGENNRTHYRQLAEIGERYWTSLLELEPSLANRQFYGLFEQVGEHMQGLRLAMYRNPDPDGVGEFSAVFIADAADPDAFIQELQQMMRLARADEIEVGNPLDAVTDEEIAALVQNLGDRTYRVRRDATNRLLLIGTRARPFLEAELAAESLELRTRARVILEQFDRLASNRSRQFFGSNLLRELNPVFRYVVAGETLPDGTPVDWISITFPETSQFYARRFAEWFGPDWNRWRVVRTDGHVIIVFSSRADLLEETLSNLQHPGESPLQVAGWNAEDQEHQFELHFDACELIPESWIHGTPSWQVMPLQPGEKHGLTSVGLSIERDALRIDAFTPVTQLRRMRHFYVY